MKVNIPINSVDVIVLVILAVLIVLAVIKVVGFFHEK